MIWHNGIVCQFYYRKGILSGTDSFAPTTLPNEKPFRPALLRDSLPLPVFWKVSKV
jgi:hypothetical protein